MRSQIAVACSVALLSAAPSQCNPFGSSKTEDEEAVASTPSESGDEPSTADDSDAPDDSDRPESNEENEPTPDDSDRAGDSRGAASDDTTSESETPAPGVAPHRALQAFDPTRLPEPVDSEDIYEDAGLKWSDASGDNLLVFTRRTRDEGEQGRTSLLVAAHWRKPSDGEWSVVRDFREIIRNCSLDMSLTPEVGPWSLTDLDDDGTKEVSFAWSGGCYGGMGSITHKVIVTEDGDKSILRGETRVRTPRKNAEDIVSGGDITEREGFAGDDERLAHAENVWAATVEDDRF